VCAAELKQLAVQQKVVDKQRIADDLRKFQEEQSRDARARRQVELDRIQHLNEQVKTNQQVVCAYVR